MLQVLMQLRECRKFFGQPPGSKITQVQQKLVLSTRDCHTDAAEDVSAPSKDSNCSPNRKKSSKAKEDEHSNVELEGLPSSYCGESGTLLRLTLNPTLETTSIKITSSSPNARDKGSKVKVLQVKPRNGGSDGINDAASSQSERGESENNSSPSSPKLVSATKRGKNVKRKLSRTVDEEANHVERIKPEKKRRKQIVEPSLASEAEVQFTADVPSLKSEPSVSENEELAMSDEDEEAPEVAAKARETVQSTLTGGGTKDPYPDWKAQEPVPYAALCTTFSLIELTTKRLIILSLCAQFLRQVLRLTPSDLLPTVQLMINKLAADYAGVELGIGESLIMKAIGETTGRSLATIKADQNEIGDLGLVAAKSRSNQPTMFKPKPLTVRGVHEGLMAIATVTGNGAQNRKIGLIKKLLSAADSQSTGKDKGVDITKDKGGPSEAKFLIRFLEGKLRLGLAEKTVLVALAQAVVAHEADVKGKVPSTEQLAKGEAILKSVYRYNPLHAGDP